MQYHTKETIDKVYLKTFQAVALQKYTIRFSDKAMGTIQANRMAWGGGEYAALFISVSVDGDNVCIEARFTKDPGVIGRGSPAKWAVEFRDELKKALPDLTFEVIGPGL